ncbi:MAG: iron-containing alcohol dehydrogenase [Sulfolobales archaeon]|nr:iron-containing alcohol dehydrogenase [Ignisphaera sp.]MCX8199806.1 iron-containing alcohol dehydrogenase [Sulfolobales archaeon]MDW8084954.1 iron-containing alcohol dehydrogenase [Ignisphaera sp.]
MKLKNFVIRSGRTVDYFGVNSIGGIEGLVSNVKRVYIVTSRNAARVSGALNDVIAVLNKFRTSYRVYDKVLPNPSRDVVQDVAVDVWRFGAECVIAIGGGSVIDTAKIASVIAKCGGSVEDYIADSQRFCGSIPVIAVNLTHGTGSEVNRYAVVTMEQPRAKVGIASEYMYPIVSIDDPKYLLSLPLNQTIYTTLDAFYHAVEAACGRNSSPYVVAIAEEVVRIISKWLPKVVRNLGDMDGRSWLLYASMLAGIAIDNSRAHIIHAIENVLSGMNTSLPHGAGLAMLGPTALPYLYASEYENLYRALRHIDPSIQPDPSDSVKVGEALREFQQSIGFSERLSDYGFTVDDADRVAETVEKVLSYALKQAPIDVTREIIRGIYLGAL